MVLLGRFTGGRMNESTVFLCACHQQLSSTSFSSLSSTFLHPLPSSPLASTPFPFPHQQHLPWTTLKEPTPFCGTQPGSMAEPRTAAAAALIAVKPVSGVWGQGDGREARARGAAAGINAMDLSADCGGRMVVPNTKVRGGA
ncbi:unnamed protein product [Closterium sp. NIES-65]|nr:unnamed protein product [Closterium sp. NIES-65]CAI5963307.1 unnamed protein product [Closterium sp. NIES-65]